LRKRVLSFLLLVLILGILGVNPPVLHAAQIQVVTTFSILHDFVSQVGGEQVVVNSLVPAGADPHTWEPSPREASLVAKADLVVANGAGFDDWLLPLVQNAARPGVPIVLASEGLSVFEQDHDHQGHQHGHESDPHLWLSVPNAIAYVEKITAALAELSPEHSQYFTGRSKVYLQELEALDQKMLELLAEISPKNRVLVTYHNAFSYLAERYGFEVAEFLVENPEAEPSPRDLGRLVELLRNLSKPVVFTEPQLTSGTRYVQALAREVGAQVYVLYSDSLTSEVSTYVEMMEYNLQVLLEALR
jgi:zinc/manganese transport system substrate-binding protein